MRVIPAIPALVLAAVGPNGAHAQWGYGPPAQVYVIPAPYPPVVVAPAPYYAGPAGVVAPPPYNYYAGQPVVVNPYTGRWCSFRPSGYRWCWTP